MGLHGGTMRRMDMEGRPVPLYTQSTLLVGCNVHGEKASEGRTGIVIRNLRGLLA